MKVRALVLMFTEVEVDDDWSHWDKYKADHILRKVLHGEQTVIDITCLDHDTDPDKLKERADMRLEGIA